MLVATLHHTPRNWHYGVCDNSWRWEKRMVTQVMLAPNPYRSGKIDRVIVISKNDGTSRHVVLSVDGISRNLHIMKGLDKGYYYATKFWGFVSAATLVGGIVFSFLWHWWVFIPGLIVSMLIFKSNRMTVADFARQSITSKPGAYDYFSSVGLIWETNAESVVPG